MMSNLPNPPPASGTFHLPCTDHRPTHTLDLETQWVVISCETCKMAVHLHPQTYADLMIAIEIDEIGEAIVGRK